MNYYIWLFILGAKWYTRTRNLRPEGTTTPPENRVLPIGAESTERGVPRWVRIKNMNRRVIQVRQHQLKGTEVYVRGRGCHRRWRFDGIPLRSLPWSITVCIATSPVSSVSAFLQSFGQGDGRGWIVSVNLIILFPDLPCWTLRTQVWIVPCGFLYFRFVLCNSVEGFVTDKD